MTKKTEQLKYTFAGLIARASMPLFLFCSGCGLVGMAGSLTDDENKIPAEFDLTKAKDSKILVLVDQPAYLSAEVNLRQYLTEAINASLESKLKFKAERLFTYDQLSDFRIGRSDFRELSPSQVGSALDANMVILVIIDNYELLKLSGTDYYRGMLSARALLLDCSNGNRLWPAETESRIIKVGFEVERAGREVTAARLAGDAAYCITRYFYNCPKRSFKIADDLARTGWTDWK